MVNYFAEEGGEMAASLGDKAAEGSAESGGGRYKIAACQIISSASAAECTLAFFRSQERPDCIEWEEL